MLLDLPASRADWIPPARPGPGPPIRGQVQRQPGQGGERRWYFVPAPFRSHNGSWKETDEATEASISRNNNSLYGHFVICTRNNENKTWPRPWPLEFIATSSPARSVAGLFPVGWPIPKRAFKPRSGSPRYTQASNSEHSLLPAPEVDRPRRSAKGNTNPHEAIQIQIMAFANRRAPLYSMPRARNLLPTTGSRRQRGWFPMCNLSLSFANSSSGEPACHDGCFCRGNSTDDLGRRGARSSQCQSRSPKSSYCRGPFGFLCTCFQRMANSLRTRNPLPAHFASIVPQEIWQLSMRQRQHIKHTWLRIELNYYNAQSATIQSLVWHKKTTALH